MASRDVNDLIRRITYSGQCEIRSDQMQGAFNCDKNNAVMRDKLARAGTMVHRVSLSAEKNQSPDLLVGWCLDNLGERYHRWSYRGGGIWMFLNE